MLQTSEDLNEGNNCELGSETLPSPLTKITTKT
jgi:hypothetical protein